MGDIWVVGFNFCLLKVLVMVAYILFPFSLKKGFNILLNDGPANLQKINSDVCLIC